MLEPKPQFCECGVPITPGVARVSENKFGKFLCIDCQLKERLATEPEKLAKFVNKEVRKRYKN